jgi:hypothetical protein
MNKHILRDASAGLWVASAKAIPRHKAEFGNEMHGIHRRALTEVGYKATRFIHMLHEHGDLQTAKILIRAATVSEGYTALWERRHLDLTVEALIHRNARQA